MSDILEAFAAESAEILEGIEASIADLAAGSREAVDRLFRGVHTLKGSASIVGLSHLEAFAHAFESRLSALRSGGYAAGPDLPDLLMSCRDRLVFLLSESSPRIGIDAPIAPVGLSDDDAGLLADLDRALGSAPAPDGRGGREAAAPAEGREPPPLSALVEAQPAAGSGYARVSNRKLDLMLEEASELTQSLSEFGSRLKALDDSSLFEDFMGLHALAARLYRSVLGARTIPFGEAVERYRRTVDDISRERGKEIDFEVRGAETEIDKGLADSLSEPLLHLVRNAADHGVESPEERIGAGKGRRGRVALSARREGGFLLVTVADDGRGVDRAAVREQALKRGMDLAEVERKGQDVLSLLLLPGFSLSSKVTTWSGRGVGLDAVERGVRRARGSLRLSTETGRGFSAEIRLPLSLSLVEGFLAEAGGARLLIPFDAVDHCEAVPPGAPDAGSLGTLAIGGRLVSALDLSRLYGERESPGRVAVVVDSLGTRVAFLVDSVAEVLSAAVRPLDRNLADSPGVVGVAALGDGSLALVLDAAELVKFALGA